MYFVHRPFSFDHMKVVVLISSSRAYCLNAINAIIVIIINCNEIVKSALA